MIKKTSIEGVFTIHNKSFIDIRGAINEIYRLDQVNGFQNVQITHTRSKSGVLRGLHAQGWNRIVYPVNGKIIQVLIDIRENSKTFGKVEKWMIDDKNRMAVFIPRYVANGYYVLGKQDVDYLYILDSYYDEKYSKGILWNDPDLKINWGIINPIISSKDKKNLKLSKLLL